MANIKNRIERLEGNRLQQGNAAAGARAELFRRLDRIKRHNEATRRFSAEPREVDIESLKTFFSTRPYLSDETKNSVLTTLDNMGE